MDGDFEGAIDPDGDRRPRGQIDLPTLRAGGDTSNATETAWGLYDFYVYLQLKQGTDLKKLESKLPAFCYCRPPWG